MSSTDASNKESLISDLKNLQTKLEPVLARDRQRIEGEGRPFDLLGWVMGAPDSHKYPGGPAFLVSLLYLLIHCFALLVICIVNDNDFFATARAVKQYYVMFHACTFSFN